MRSRLHERNAETTAIDDLIQQLGHGRGGAVVIEARAGRGKSSLVEYAVDTARGLGARILVARARHLESAAPFEVLRRLLGPAVEGLGGAANLTGAATFAAPLFTPGAEPAQGVDYGCQWLVARFAEDAPLVLAVDDAHWADSASLRVLLEVQADISVQPVLLVLASRPVENPEAQRRLATMAAQADCVVLTPALLTRAGVAAVITDALGEPTNDRFVDDCLTVSGGNAFYLHELLRGYRQEARPDLQAVVRKGNRSLRRTMSWRLSELGFDAAALAQSAAVLGDGSSLPVAAALANLPDPVAVAEAARLEAASIFAQGDPTEFVHPLVRAAVEDTLTAVELGELHARAARILWARDAAPSIVVPHLIASPGSGDSRVAEYLNDRGVAALQSGAVTVASRLLRRALDEDAPSPDRNALLVQLAEAEHAEGDLEQAREHLEQARASDQRETSLRATAELFDLLANGSRLDDVVRLHGEALAMRPYGDSVAEVRVRAHLLANVFMDIDTSLRDLPPQLGEIDTSTLGTSRGVDRYFLVVASILERTSGHGTTDRLHANLARVAARLRESAVDLEQWDVWAVLTAAPVMADEQLDETDQLLREIEPAVARLRGTSPWMQAELDRRLALNMMRRGDFEGALVAVEAATEFADRHGLTAYVETRRFIEGWIALERGDHASAGHLLSSRFGDDTLYPALGALLRGDVAAATALVNGLGLSVEPDASVRPIEAELEPHLVASHVFEAAGDATRARAEADRELAIRRTYGPKFRLALALRRRASFLPARQALGMLEEATTLAGATPRRPVQARVLASYGSSLRRSEKHEAARQVLYRALECAADLGMERVALRARAELAEAGGRPRRARRTGPTSLTPAQREVAGLAISGLTNREIAEKLYVTIKTVETHLAAVYRKLAIDGRDELGVALGRAGHPDGAMTAS